MNRYKARRPWKINSSFKNCPSPELSPIKPGMVCVTLFSLVEHEKFIDPISCIFPELGSGPGFIEESMLDLQNDKAHPEVDAKIQPFIICTEDRKKDSSRKILGRMDVNSLKNSIRNTGKYWVKKEKIALNQTHPDNSLCLKKR